MIEILISAKLLIVYVSPGDLMPRRGENGVTLLYPKEESYRKDIVKAMESGNEEEALKMVRALIVPDYVKSLSEFGKKAVGNRLGVKFNVKKSSDSSVSIDPDVELGASDFKWLKRFDKQEQNVNVFFVNKGRLPTKGDEKYMAPLRPKRMGMNENKKVLGGHSHAKAEMIEHLIKAICHGTDVEYACAIMVYLNAKQPEEFKAVLPLLNWEPAVTVLTIANCGLAELVPSTMKLLLEAGKLGGDVDAKKYATLLNSGTGGAGILSGDQVLSAQKAVRSELSRSMDAVNITGAVNGLYTGLLSGNVGAQGKALPESTLRLLGGIAKKKWLDEMAYTVGTAMTLIRKDPMSNEALVKELLMDYVCGSRIGSNSEGELYLTSDSYVRGSVDRSAQLATLNRFLASSAFLHVLLPDNVAKTSMGDPTSTLPSLYNVESNACSRIMSMQ